MSGVLLPAAKLKDIKFQVAYEETPIIEALHKFVYKRVSALPIVDKEVRNRGNEKC